MTPASAILWDAAVIAVVILFLWRTPQVIRRHHRHHRWANRRFMAGYRAGFRAAHPSVSRTTVEARPASWLPVVRPRTPAGAAAGAHAPAGPTGAPSPVGSAGSSSRPEALRRLVGYGELVFRTIRLEGGEVVVRHANNVELVVLLDEQGRPLVREISPLVWLRPSFSEIAHGFPGAEVAAGLPLLMPVGRCDQWNARELLPETKKRDRCKVCQAAEQRGTR